MAIAEQIPEPKVPVITKYHRMRLAREDAGYHSHAAFAGPLSAELGIPTVPASTIGAWERGTNQPSRKGLRESDVDRAWAAVCGVPLDWLTRGIGTITRCSRLASVEDFGQAELPFPIARYLSAV